MVIVIIVISSRMGNKFNINAISRIGEVALLKRICRRLPLRGDVIIGAGDDCAVVRGGPADKFDYLLKSDGVVEGVHFTMRTPEKLIGRKALGRVLSDMAAMGGEPLWILVDLVAPPETRIKRVEGVYAGLARLAARFGIAVVGGDVSSGRELQLHVFGVGRIKRGGAALRSGAKPGEAIFVTGCLGGSLAGKHLKFQPRLQEGRWLAAGGWAHAMIDISDGLLRDMKHIADASKVGACLMLDSIPVSLAARRRSDGRSPLDHALGDGEDYELLFTVPKRKVKAFKIAWRRRFRLSCRLIGWTTGQAGRLASIDSRGRIARLNETGFEHFH